MSRMNRRLFLGWMGLGANGRWALAASPPRRIPEAEEREGDDPQGGRLPPRILARDQGDTRYLAVAFSPDGSRIITAEQAPDFRRYVDLESVFRRDGPFLAKTHGRGPSVRVWDAATGRSIRPPIEYPSYLLGVALSPDGSRVAAAGGLKYIPGPPDTLRSIRAAAIRDGGSTGSTRGFYVGSGGGAVRIWDVAEDREWLALAPRPATVDAVFWGTRYIAAVDREYVLTLWDPGHPEPFLTFNNLKGEGQGHGIYWTGSKFAFSADGSRAVAISSYTSDFVSTHPNVVKVWDASRGRGREMDIGHPSTDAVWSVALNGQGDLLATGTPRGEVILWDFDRLKVVRRCGPPVGKGAAFLAFSPDGKRIASGEPGGAVCLWDVATGRLIRRRYEGPSGVVRAFAFLKDTLRVASVSPVIPADGVEKGGSPEGSEQLRVWDVALD